MAMVMAFDDAKKNLLRLEGDAGKGTVGGALSTRFFGSRDEPDLPFANLSQQDPGRVSRVHFHIVDQFQLVVEGKGRLGRHDLAPYCVHFSRAYTPYGPLVADAGTGIRFFVMRTHPDPGSQSLAGRVEELKRIPGREPWQITSQASFPALQTSSAAATIMLQAVADMKDERGLAAYTLCMKPNAEVHAPNASAGDGQYLVVVKGSLLHDNREYNAYALVFIRSDEGPYWIHAGAEGLQALVLNFPCAQKAPADAIARGQTTTGFERWRCALCAFVYDEAAGWPEEGIAPGTRWKDVPESWSCPDCNSSKSDFQMIEL